MYGFSNDGIEKTDVLYGTENTSKIILEFLSRTNKNLDICADHTFPSVSMGIEPFKRAMQNIKKRGAKSRYIVEITKDNVLYCKDLMKIDDLRHLKGIKGNFAINESHYIACATMQQSQLLQQVIYSNVKTVVEQHQYLFETLWSISTSAEQKIKEIDEGIFPDIIEVIYDQSKVKTLYLDLIKNAKSEIMLIFPTINAIIRQEKINTILHIQKAAIQRNVKVRILMPWLFDLTEKNTVIEKFVGNFDKTNENMLNINNSISSDKFIDIRYMEPILETRSTILLIDRKFSLVVELKEDIDETFDKAIGLSIYSNSKPGVISYVSIFENLWRQIELYNNIKIANEKLEKAMNKLEIHDKILNEFIHIAAHEIRNPIQPILGLSQVLKSKITQKKGEQIKINEISPILDIIIRNIRKMNKLTDNVLDITKIEANSFYLKKETFDLKELIQDVMNDYISENNHENIVDENDYRDIKLSLFSPPISKGENEQKANFFLIEADKVRISQIIYNLLNNAFKFTNKGDTININLKKEFINGIEEAIVSIVDTGIGIDSDIFSRLFTKFATNSYRGGTGLGLFISKCIIDAHGGKIWAENNHDGKGSTFSFRLPLIPH